MKNNTYLEGAIVNRKDFVAWIGKQLSPVRVPVSALNFRRNLKADSCALIWSKNQVGGNSLPFIVVPDESLPDFFAFVNTYLLGYSPFSAFFRVIGISVYDEIASDRSSKEHFWLPQTAVGIAIAEAALRQGGRRLVEAPNVASIRSTLSCALISAAYQLHPNVPLERIASRWLAIRRGFGEDDSNSSVERCLTVVGAYIAALSDASASRQSKLYDAIRQTRTDGVVTAEVWRLLVSNIPEFQDIFNKLRGPREERVRVARSALIELATRKDRIDLMQLECIAGCVLALVGDGSFQYLPLAVDLGSSLPTSILWFAAWCSLFKATDILEYGGSVGRRVARDVFTPIEFFGAPQCDISSDELLVIRENLKISNLNAPDSSLLVVEIFPFVNSIFRLKDSAFGTGKPNISLDDLMEVERLIDRTKLFLNRAMNRDRDTDQSRLPLGDRSRRNR
ncbi:hypothetical protein NP945_14755 [Mesorhizobium sp. LMG17149]|uniref:hypothetical protein n=1 Tax=Mesorhizobium sp. LMG17149 TaxID=2968497 RepID=UPI0021197CD2|nr:hypothetical protein [Mesorhizobium sp. LMG17149]MCQ8873089.1 hypothetical protein [Mesorhizobium sp. LMG17149]